MSRSTTAYRIAVLPGHGRIQVPAEMRDEDILAALAAPEEGPDREDTNAGSAPG